MMLFYIMLKLFLKWWLNQVIGGGLIMLKKWNIRKVVNCVFRLVGIISISISQKVMILFYIMLLLLGELSVCLV